MYDSARQFIFFRNFYFNNIWSSNCTLLGTTSLWKIKLAKNLENYLFMRLAPINKLKLSKVTVLLSIAYFLCSLNKKTISTVVLLLVLKFRFWSVSYTRFSGPALKRLWKYLRLFIYYLLSKFGVKIINRFKVMIF